MNLRKEVKTDGILKAYEVGDDGKQKILKEEQIGDKDVYTRYKNYKTLKVNEDKN